MANRPALGHFPSADWVDRIRRSLMSVAPAGMSQVYPMMCGTCSNENGIKLMFMKYMHDQRGGRTEFTQEELNTTLKHQGPGSPKLSILSFPNYKYPLEEFVAENKAEDERCLADMEEKIIQA